MNTGWRRRTVLAAGAALGAAGCAPRGLAHIEGGFAGVSHERGHRLRQPWPTRAPDVTHRVHTVIAGGGVAALAAARTSLVCHHQAVAAMAATANRRQLARTKAPAVSAAAGSGMRRSSTRRRPATRLRRAWPADRG